MNKNNYPRNKSISIRTWSPSKSGPVNYMKNFKKFIRLRNGQTPRCSLVRPIPMHAVHPWICELRWVFMCLWRHNSTPEQVGSQAGKLTNISRHIYKSQARKSKKKKKKKTFTATRYAFATSNIVPSNSYVSQESAILVALSYGHILSNRSTVVFP